MRIRPFIPAAAAALSAVLLCCTPVQAAQAAEPVFVPYDSYTYSTRSGTAEAMLCPTPYRPGTVIDRSTLGVPLTSPEHMVFDGAGRLYVTDSTANALYVLDDTLALTAAVDSFEDDEGNFGFFSGPTGLFVDEDNGCLYVCDTNARRIVVLDLETRRVRRIIADVVPTGIAEDDEYLFLPTRVAVDGSGSLYVLVKNDHNGLLQLDESGRFVGYIGSNSVTFDPITRLWKRLMTKEQRRQMEQFLPVEYTDLFMDGDGLLYAVTRAGESSPVKRLNLAGKDVLSRSGYVDVCGDIVTAGADGSVLVGVAADGQDTAYVLDAARGRVFVYDAEGFLLYAFGGIGTQIGCVSVPSAIAVRGGDVYVADKGAGRITVFSRTAYAALIAQAEEHYNAGRYDESMAAWQQVLEKNANFELAYAQIGKICLRRGDYAEAMRCFELGNYRGDSVTKNTGFNKAYAEYRRETAAHWFAPVAIGCAAIAAAAVILRRVRRKKRKDGAGA